MHLEAPDGSSFDMRIVGYQFAEAAGVEYDSNWLRVRIDVSCSRGSWSVIDPFLLTYEVVELAGWLDAVAAGNRSDPEMRFTEPNLTLRLVALEGATTLRVCFWAELRPPWHTGEWTEDNHPCLDFPADADMLHGAAESLREMLAQYPQRTER